MAGDKLKTKDFVENSGELRQIYEELMKINEGYEVLMATIKKDAKIYQEQLAKNSAATVQEREEIEELDIKVGEMSQRYKKLKDTFKENSVQITILKEAQKKANLITRNQAKLAMSAEGSYNALAAQYALNKIRLNEMSEAQRSATKEGKELEAETKAIYERMKELQEATGKHVLSVGDYGKALRDLPGPLNSIVDGVEAVSNGFKAMLANPVVLVLGLIVGALTAVFKAFQQSETGAKLFNKAGAVLSGIWKGFVQVIDVAAKNIQAFFDDPLAGIKQLGDAIVNNVVNRFKGVLLLIGSLSDAFKSLIQRDFEGVKKAAQEAGSALLQFSTGFDKQQQKDLADGIRDITKTINDATEAQLKYNAAKEASYKTNARLRTELARLNAELELANAIANDDTQGYKQQQEAITQAQKALEEKAKVELRLANENLRLINLQIAANKGVYDPELYQAQSDALIGVIDAQSQLTLATRDNAELRRKIQRDEFERELDYAIDVGDAQKSLFERQLQNEKISRSERSALFDDYLAADADRFEEQKKLVNDYLGFQIDFDSLVVESSEKVIREKLRGINADDIVQGRILEIIRDRKAAFQDLIETEQDLIEQRNKTLGAEGLQLLKIDSVDEAQAKRLLKGAIDDFNQYSKEIANQGSFWDFLKFDDPQRAALMDTVNFIKDAFSQILDARIELADRSVDNANKELEVAENALQAEKEKRDRGEANRVEFEEKQVAKRKKEREKALEEQEKAVKAQQALQTIEQTTNMITASSKIWSSFSSLGPAGPALAVAAIAAMWGSFIASKVKAAQLARSEYGEGHYEELNYGGSHASGNDISLARDRHGRERRVERGESFAVFNKRAVGRYGDTIRDLVDAVNHGTLERMMNNNEMVEQFGFNYMGPDMSRTERELAAIRKQGEGESLQVASWGYIKKYKNKITKVRVRN